MSELYRASPLGIVAAVLTGVIHGGLFGMGAIYAREIGLDVGQVAWFMALVMFGALFSQWPLGWLSDRFDRRRVMLGAALVGAAAPAVVAVGLVEPTGSAALAMMFVLGGATLPLYSLSLSQVNDYLSPHQMVGASGTLVFVTGCGLIVGPLAAAFALEAMGPPGFLQCLVAVHAVLAGFIVFRMGRRAAKPVEEQAGYVPAGTRSSSMLIELAAEEGRELAGATGSGSRPEPDSPPDPEAGGRWEDRRLRGAPAARRPPRARSARRRGNERSRERYAARGRRAGSDRAMRYRRRRREGAERSAAVGHRLSKIYTRTGDGGTTASATAHGWTRTRPALRRWARSTSSTVASEQSSFTLSTTRCAPVFSTSSTRSSTSAGSSPSPVRPS